MAATLAAPPARYFASLDIETDGPNPILNSMLELCVVLYDQHRKEVDSVDVIMKAAPGKVQNDATMKNFWSKFPDAWSHVTNAAKAVTPQEGMKVFAAKYRHWVDTFGADNVSFFAKPSSFDWPFVQNYYALYGPETCAIERPLPYRLSCVSSILDTYLQVWGLDKGANKPILERELQRTYQVTLRFR